MLAGHSVWISDASRLIDPPEKWFETLASGAKHDHTFAAVSARPPVPVIDVAADRLRKAKPRPIEVYRSGLTVVLPEDSRFGALIRWKRVVDSGDGSSHFRPSASIRQHLRQITRFAIFEFGRSESDRA